MTNNQLHKVVVRMIISSSSNLHLINPSYNGNMKAGNI